MTHASANTTFQIKNAIVLLIHIVENVFVVIFKIQYFANSVILIYVPTDTFLCLKTAFSVFVKKTQIKMNASQSTAKSSQIRENAFVWFTLNTKIANA